MKTQQTSGSKPTSNPVTFHRLYRQSSPPPPRPWRQPGSNPKAECPTPHCTGTRCFGVPVSRIRSLFRQALHPYSYRPVILDFLLGLAEDRWQRETRKTQQASAGTCLEIPEHAPTSSPLRFVPSNGPESPFRTG